MVGWVRINTLPCTCPDPNPLTFNLHVALNSPSNTRLQPKEHMCVCMHRAPTDLHSPPWGGGLLALNAHGTKGAGGNFSSGYNGSPRGVGGSFGDHFSWGLGYCGAFLGDWMDGSMT